MLPLESRAALAIVEPPPPNAEDSSAAICLPEASSTASSGVSPWGQPPRPPAIHIFNTEPNTAIFPFGIGSTPFAAAFETGRNCSADEEEAANAGKHVSVRSAKSVVPRRVLQEILRRRRPIFTRSPRHVRRQEMVALILRKRAGFNGG